MGIDNIMPFKIHPHSELSTRYFVSVLIISHHVHGDDIQSPVLLILYNH